MNSAISATATSGVETVVIKGTVKVSAAAIPITVFRALLILKFSISNLSETNPPVMLESPNAKNGIQHSSPMRSNDTLRSSFKYFGIGTFQHHRRLGLG